MNILVDQLPTAIEVDGSEYPINYDFRTCLRILMAFEDQTLAQIEKQAILLKNLYVEQPKNITEAIQKGIKFLDGGEDRKDEVKNSPRIYSFQNDAQFIVAAFQQTHGIDLETAEMHWWKFMALFMDLGGETTFSNLVSLRKRVKTGKATKEERAAARELGEIFDLTEIDNRTLEEREAEDEFMKLLKQGKGV
ncbi:MAG: hypothetical protein C4545_04030 [Anaerolineaceae bacterium]|jgi:hypothetical protein|nr:MAG: hypothetical protein C4545_04030 [Anaerolineaceae bacterium]